MNAINVIAPYKHHGMWVFDDPRVGLNQEPFVAGADAMIDRVVADIPNADKGFTLSGRHMAGAEFSAADVQMMFPLEFAAFAKLVDARHARLRDYLARMQARPAYRRAVDKGGAYAFDAASAHDAAPFPRPSR